MELNIELTKRKMQLTIKHLKTFKKSLYIYLNNFTLYPSWNIWELLDINRKHSESCQI